MYAASNDESHGRRMAPVALVTCIDSRPTEARTVWARGYFEKSATMVPTLAPSAALNAPR